MRIVIYLLLGAVVLAAVVYGLRLVWYAFFPDKRSDGHLKGDREKKSFPFLPVLPPPLDARSGQLFFFGVLLLFLLMAIERIMVNRETPTDFTPPPTVDERSVVQERFY